MLHLVRNNNPFTVIILFVYTLVISARCLIAPVLPSEIESQFFYNAILKLTDTIFIGSAYIYTIVSVLFVFAQALYLNYVSVRRKLFVKNTYLAAFTYITLVGLYMPFGYFSLSLLTNWLIIAFLDYILGIAQNNNPKKAIYNAGFLVGLSTLLGFSSVVMLLFLLVAITVLRSPSLSEWVVAMVGFITPIYLAAGIMYINGSLQLMPAWVSLGVNLFSSIDNPPYTVGLLSGIIILFVMGNYVLQRQVSKVTVNIRREWQVVGIGFFLAIIMAVFTPKQINTAWLVILPFLVLFCSGAYHNEKNKAFSNIAFYFTILLMIFCQIVA